MENRYELLTPDEIEAAKAAAPVAYVPLGAFEWRSWHLLTGLDGVKAHEPCLHVADEAGGVVLLPVYFGIGGEHEEYETSLMVLEVEIRRLVERTYRRLATLNCEVIVSITGHYAGEQVEMINEVATDIKSKTDATVVALPEHEAYPDERQSDHAGKWETSILWALRPELVELERFDDHPEDRHQGVYATDPEEASKELGEGTVSLWTVPAVV